MSECAGAMVEVADTMDLYLSMFERFEKRRGRGAWLLPIRKAAISRFAELGFPTTDDEEWRYTNVGPIAGTAFEPAPEGAFSTEKLRPFLFDGGAAAPRLVIVNGRFAPKLSSMDALPDGVRLMSLHEAIDREDETVRTHLARHARYEDQAFTALNTALLDDGAFLEVTRG
ncbi:MAG: hypothetical protein Q7R41_05680, partial [Phycisphaerales bacterium]|nr:hypothetical protein [Phycisphaerales bacterium]